MARIDLQKARGEGYAGDVLRLEGSSVLVGRAEECDVRLASEISSRRHASLYVHGGRWIVEDHGSRNGTYLNGVKVGMAILRAGDLLRFGRGEQVFRVAALDPPPSSGPADVKARIIRPPAPPAKTRNEDIPTLQPVAGPVQERTIPLSARPTREVAPAGGERRFALSLVLSLVGIAFAILTAGRVWPESRFPYEWVTTPMDHALENIARLAPERFAELVPWPLAALLAIEFGLLGLTLARPLRRMPWTLLLVGAHVVAALLILDPGG
jgi:hypothetical protein